MKWSGFAGVAVEDAGTVTSLHSRGAATGEEGRAKDGFPARVLGRRDHRRTGIGVSSTTPESVRVSSSPRSVSSSTFSAAGERRVLAGRKVMQQMTDTGLAVPTGALAGGHAEPRCTFARGAC
jgi:hypothetical protein